MTNKQIAQQFATLADLMELTEEDDFRIKSYRFTYQTIRKLDLPLADMTEAEVKALKGIGPATSAKIKELLQTGKLSALNQYREKVPAGVAEMLRLDGFGPKKVRTIWKELEIESIGELMYACEENRLLELKGFGPKTQAELIKSIEHYERGAGKMRFDVAEEAAEEVRLVLSNTDPDAQVWFVGEIRRLMPVVSVPELLMSTHLSPARIKEKLPQTSMMEIREKWADVTFAEGAKPIRVHFCQPNELGSKLFLHSCDSKFLERFIEKTKGMDFKGLQTEEAVFERAGLPFIAPEIREGDRSIYQGYAGTLPRLIEPTDLKGVLHVHTKWSDGTYSTEEMARHAQQLGYQYIGITDHSQSAFYANGLKPDRVREQWAEIDQLNAKFAPFRILKGIEADILNDGALDYDDALLEGFDFVIASVHSNLKMSKDKATSRVLKAIQHPRTTILGHPTGRLLLSRQGYDLDWPTIFAACAKYRVAIEVNANPHRLDLDYTLIEQAVAAGCMIAINPDAHSAQGLEDTRYGVNVARKGYLTAEQCLNCLDAASMLKWKSHD